MKELDLVQRSPLWGGFECPGGQLVAEQCPRLWPIKEELSGR